MKADRLELRYKRPTLKTHGHRQIIFNDKVLGYFIRQMDLRGYMKWYVLFDQSDYQDAHFFNRDEIKKYIVSQVKREGIKLLVMETR